MKTKVKKEGQKCSIDPRQRLKKDSSKKAPGSSANQRKKLMTNTTKVPDEPLKRFPSLSLALPIKGFNPFRVNPNGTPRLPGKKTNTIWHTRNARQTSKADTKKTPPEDVERLRTINAISMRLQGVEVPGNLGLVQGPVSFEEIFEVLGLDEEGKERKESQFEPILS